MPSVSPRAARFSLVALGIASGVLWRAEVELHGWAGLTWLDYFHWAIPAGVAMLVVWVALVAPLERRRRIALAATLAVLAVPLYVATLAVLSLVFVNGPSAAFALAGLGTTGLLVADVIACAPILPLVVLAVARGFGIRAPVSRQIACVVLWLLAAPVAIALLAVTHHAGGADALHAIKSGFVVPLLVISLGVPFVR